jgi:hypothetical protein
MTVLRKIQLVSLFAGISLLAACSSQPTTGPAATRPSATRAPIVSQGDAILGALRASQVERNSNQALLLVERALQQTPDRPELVWLAARLCGDVPRCEPQEYETRLRKLDPGNAVVWMGPLARAQRKGDTAAAEQILEAMGREERFDVYWNSLLWQGALALSAQAPQPAPKVLNGPLTNAINDVANWLTAVAMPPFDGLSSACARERTNDPAVAERCRRVGKVLQEGDTYAADAVGTGIAQRSVSPNSPTIIALSEHAAVLEYQHDGAREIMGSQVEREKLSAELIELMKKLRREQDVSLAVLRWAGVPLRPRR